MLNGCGGGDDSYITIKYILPNPLPAASSAPAAQFPNLSAYQIMLPVFREHYNNIIPPLLLHSHPTLSTKITTKRHERGATGTTIQIKWWKGGEQLRNEHRNGMGLINLSHDVQINSRRI